MKKYSSLIFVLLMLILTSCNKKDHVHNYILTVIEPSCVGEGYDLYICECGDTYQENFIREFGHDYGEYKYDDKNFIRYKECIHCKQKGYEQDYQIDDFSRLYDFEYKLIDNKKPVCYLKEKNTTNIIYVFEGTIISEDIWEEPTCFNEGKYTVWVEFIVLNDIEICQRFIYDIPRLEHKMSEWKELIHEGFGFNGEYYKECEYHCGFIIYK